ncbi:hypothetical protein ANME2D_02798 [Candidatus Methanoperedens nitroreducens]|uniref:Glycosyltransferase RgtA/B/C/D-like domain-containing protein n=2 Tax=Candidatus Methanoperedens nitratireducens TaxID=1392998 RepID=A0A062V2B1_9EURY|nr:hypothetical protein ANME2D_02798 [Candidatus Methanoperedens nitroreducens]
MLPERWVDIITNRFLIYIFVLIILSIYITGSPHFNYRFPFHADEWHNIKIAQEILKEEKIILYNPFLAGNPYYINFNEEAHGVTNTNSAMWQINYNLLVALSSLFTGIPALEMGLILPTLFTFIMSFNTFILVRYLTKNDLPAFMSGVFVMTLKSNVTFLGPWFLVASSFGLAFIPLILYLFLKSLVSGKYLPILLFVFAATTLAHPASAIIFIPIFGLYMIFNPRIVKHNKNRFLISIAILLILLLVIVPFEGSVISYIVKILKVLIFPRSDPINGFVAVMQFPAYMGIIAFVLSIFGLFKTMTEDEAKILPLSVDALLPLILAYIYLGYAFLAPYERVVLYISEILMILAGIGLYHIYRSIGNKRTAVILIVMILILQISSIPAYRDDIPLIMGPEEYGAILWLRDNAPPDAVVLAAPGSSEAIGVIGGQKVISIMRGRLGSSEESINKSMGFFRGNTEMKEKILLELKPDYVYSREEISLESLELVHSENKIYIYKVRWQSY